jgi:small-conductance mechanosensitive channel
MRLAARALGDTPTAGRRLAAFAISFGEWLLPYLGVMSIVVAGVLTGILGSRGNLVLESLPAAAFILLLARWLSLRVFPRDDRQLPLLSLGPSERATGRLSGGSLGLVVAGFAYVQDLADGFDWSEAARNVMIFPLMVLASLLLLRLARLLMRHSKAAANEPETELTFRSKLVRILARALWALALLAPLLSAIGYMSAAEAMMLPALLSLMMIAALLLVQRVLSEVYIMLRGNAQSIDDSLFPVLLGFFLVLGSVPVFALIWGARPAQLQEAWLSFTQGVSFGGITLSPTGFLILAVVFTLGYLLTRLIQGTLKNAILPKTKLDMGGRNAIVSGVGYVGIFLAALVSITAAGIDLSSLAIVAGALSVGIGFGLQNIVSNFVAGIILLIERPISEGDWIEVGGQHGYVRSISVRSTRIETFDRTDVIVPNADFVSGTVTNYTRGNTVGRVIVPVGVAYGTDTRRVEKILRDVAEAHPMVLMQPPPTVLFQNFGASSLDFEIRAILRDVNWVASVKSDMNHEIARRFAEEGIEIPFPQQDVWFRNATAEAQEPKAPAKPMTNQGPAALTEGDVEGEGDGDGR